MNRKLKLLVVLMTSVQVICSAQSDQALSLSLTKESTKLPSGRSFGSPFHPGFEFGYERFLGDLGKHQLSLALKVGYYQHKDFHRGLTVKPALNYFYQIRSNFYVGTELNVGYLRTYIDRPLYEQNENGEYQKIRNSGKSRFMPSISLSTGYQFLREDHKHLDLFIKYEFGIETPFSKGIGIPLFPHSFLHLGTRWHAFN